MLCNPITYQLSGWTSCCIGAAPLLRVMGRVVKQSFVLAVWLNACSVSNRGICCIHIVPWQLCGEKGAFQAPPQKKKKKSASPCRILWRAKTQALKNYILYKTGKSILQSTPNGHMGVDEPTSSRQQHDLAKASSQVRLATSSLISAALEMLMFDVEVNSIKFGEKKRRQMNIDMIVGLYSEMCHQVLSQILTSQAMVDHYQTKLKYEWNL